MHVLGQQANPIYEVYLIRGYQAQNLLKTDMAKLHRIASGLAILMKIATPLAMLPNSSIPTYKYEPSSGVSNTLQSFQTHEKTLILLFVSNTLAYIGVSKFCLSPDSKRLRGESFCSVFPFSRFIMRLSMICLIQLVRIYASEKMSREHMSKVSRKRLCYHLGMHCLLSLLGKVFEIFGCSLFLSIYKMSIDILFLFRAEHRHVGSDNFNLFSSRSHTIFTLVNFPMTSKFLSVDFHFAFFMTLCFYLCWGFGEHLYKHSSSVFIPQKSPEVWINYLWTTE
ncbi:hypothetical protein RND81_04G022500 [Saponaria officinalis]|uniref:Uncharacterized protein n=1 Tax=Saponaria officinalis TaxID=3572 RepID=A0AAW1LHV9_SAPOF